MDLKRELEITAAAGGMIGDATRAQWAELLERQGGSLVRMTIGKLRQRLSKRQVSVAEVAKELGHKLKAEAGAALELAAAAPSRALVIAASAEGSGALAALDAVVDAIPEGDDDQVEEPEAEAPAVDELEPTPAPTPQPATERSRAPATNKEATVPKQIPTADLREIAKQLGTFKVADLAKKAKCSPPTARKAIEEMEADGFIVREEAGNRRSPFVLAGRGASKPGSAPGGSVKPAAARRSPDQRPPAPIAWAPGGLDGRFDELLGFLIDAYAEKHDLGPKPSARRALLEAAAAVFPTEG